MEYLTLKNIGLFQYHRTSETVYVLWWFYDFNQILQKSTLPQWWQSNWMYDKSYTCLLHCICHWLWSGLTWEKAYGNLFIPIVPALLHIHPIRYKSKNKHWNFFYHPWYNTHIRTKAVGLALYVHCSGVVSSMCSLCYKPGMKIRAAYCGLGDGVLGIRCSGIRCHWWISPISNLGMQCLWDTVSACIHPSWIFHLKQEALRECKPSPRLVWRAWNSLLKHEKCRLLLLVSLSWKFHEHPSIWYSVMLPTNMDTENKKRNPVSKGLHLLSPKCSRLFLVSKPTYPKNFMKIHWSILLWCC